jgi:hypothetical protein
MCSVLYITGNRLRLGLVLSYKTLKFVRCFLYRNFHELECTYAIISTTSRHTGILSYYENEMYTVHLYMSFIHTLVILMPYLNAKALFLCLILQKKLLEDGIYLFYQPHIHICCQRILLFLRNMFKFLGHTQFLEVCTTSKEIMLFHDNGFVLLRFARAFN